MSGSRRRCLGWMPSAWDRGRGAPPLWAAGAIPGHHTGRQAMETVQSLGEVERAALAGAAPQTRLEVVLEPTGPSWLPIAVFFTSRGHTVYRVSSAKAHDLRRVLSRQAKSNGIDADTPARLPPVDPPGPHPLKLPRAQRAALDRRLRG